MSTTTAEVSLLTRSEVWSSQLKEILQDELMAARFVRTLTEFPDGDTFKIPSIGEARVDDYVEDTAVKYRPLDTGQFQFQVTEYVQSGHSITKKAEQDMFYMNELVSKFVPYEHRAIMEHYEAFVLSRPEAGYTANDQVAINGAFHRLAGGNAGKLELADFAYADYALTKANVPANNRVAIVDPSVIYESNTLTNLVSLDSNPKWEGIVADNIASGMKFVKNIYGFDVYTSNYLPEVTDNALNDRTGGNAVDMSGLTAKASYFFSAAQEITPWVAAWRQMPKVDSEFNKDFQRTEFVTTARYGVGFYRPENMVMIGHNTAITA